MNGVAMARNGSILWENDAVGSRKVFRYLRGLRKPYKIKKWLLKSKNAEIPYFTVYYAVWGLSLGSFIQLNQLNQSSVALAPHGGAECLGP